MTIDRLVLKETKYPESLDWSLVEKWAHGIPVYRENDPNKPEWKPTPVIEADFSSDGYGNISIKNEADTSSNPTGTIKDRAAWELVTLFRDYARALILKKKSIDGSIELERIPRLSLISAGNVANSVSRMFHIYGLPPVKVLVDLTMPANRIETLKNMYADVYLTDLSERRLNANDIKLLTNNTRGVDITSVRSIEPHAIFYDWHAHECFNANPNEIYVPYGSGRLLENLLTWQQRTLRGYIEDKRDPRLRNSVQNVVSMSVLGSEPIDINSGADKLTKKFNLNIFDDHDIGALEMFSFTGKNSGIYKVNEEKIIQAYELMQRHCNTEPSGAAGFALYLQRFEDGLIDSSKKILVVNTGKGI